MIIIILKSRYLNEYKYLGGVTISIIVYPSQKLKADRLFILIVLSEFIVVRNRKGCPGSCSVLSRMIKVSPFGT